LPIIFPAVAEKVIEKVVEKVKEVATYITANLTNNMSALVHRYPITKPSLPTPSVVKTVMSISITFYSLITYLKQLSYIIFARPTKPSASFLNTFSVSIGGVRAVDAKKNYPSYNIVSRPSKPAPAVTQFSTSIDVRKSP
jgi:hypothetical protein